MKNVSSATLSPQLSHLYICLSGCKLVEAAVNGWSGLLLGELQTLSSAILILQGCSKVDLVKTSMLLLLSPKPWVQQLIRTQIKNVKCCNAFKSHLQHGKRETAQLFGTKHLQWFFGFSPYILLTLGCRCAWGVSSGAFGVSFVSAPSVPSGVGGRTRSFSQAGSQRRQRRQGCRHTLVVVHPRNRRSEFNLGEQSNLFLSTVF